VRIRPVTCDDVSRILNRGGTMIGTARSTEFREREGRVPGSAQPRGARHRPARRDRRRRHLSGADLLRTEWPSLSDELVADGAVDRETADRCPALRIVGLVG
jgi:6-phosphofructokinase 1